MSIKWLNDSLYSEPLSPGCKMCAEGSKMVLLITGLCSSSCFYCPLSQKKLGKDYIYADEWRLNNEKDYEKLVLEAKYIEASGAGITGGDPLIVWKRTKDYISFLKNEFGKNFHIHLYTSGIKNGNHIEDIVAAGLDEIRFHPIPNLWVKLDKSLYPQIVKKSIELNCDTAFEIPSIPGYENDMFKLIEWATENNVSWVNINELEFSETNAGILKSKGFTVKDDISAAVKSSQETAYSVFKKTSNLEIGVHYCSSSFKDGIQLRNRIKRRAKNIAKSGEIITEDGTLLKGVIVLEDKTSKEIYDLLINILRINKKFLYIDKEKNRVEISPKVLEKYVDELLKQGFKCFIVEEYPTADRLEVEKIPITIR
jgi:pyruvate formate-lyase activating enzyme-like uncharacterized protein